MKRLYPLLTIGLFGLLCSVPSSWAQVCDDAQICTNPDMCSNGECIGTPLTGPTCDDGNECTGPDSCAGGVCMPGAPLSGGSCDDGNPCTMNDTCVSGICQGTPVANDTPCGSAECASCQNGQCAPIIAMQGMPCTDLLGACTENDVCLGIICLGMFKSCPDSDNNKCTLDTCNPATGQCQNFGAIPCGDCNTCDPAVGCVAANEGGACDDGNVCTSNSTCTGGNCVAGGAAEGTPTDTPTEGSTATATETIGTPTDTPTQGGTPTDTPNAGTPTDTPTTGPSATPSDTAIVTPTDTPTLGPTDTPTEAGTATATFTDTPIQAPTDTPTGTPAGTATATLTPTGTPAGTTATVTATATGTPAGTATATITGVATSTATHTPLTPASTPTSTPSGGAATPTHTATGGATSTATGGATSTATGGATSTATGGATSTATGAATSTATGGATSTVTNTSGATATPTATGSATPTTTGSTPTAVSTATATNTSLPIDATIIIGSATGEPGSTVAISVSLDTTVAVAGTQNDITFDPLAPIAANGSGKPDCTVNAGIDKTGTSFAFEPADCTPGTDCTSVRALVLSFDSTCPICGTPTTECPGVLPCPQVLYTCNVAISAEATGTIPLPCSNAVGADPDGNQVGTDCNNGSITVGVPSAATITIGTAVGAAGDFVPLEVTFDTEVEVAGTQNDITFQPQAAIAAGSNGKPMCTVNPDIGKTGTSFAFQPPGCTVGSTCTTVRALVLSLDDVCPICGAPTTMCPGVIPCPTVLYTCTIAIAATAADGTYPLTCSHDAASDPQGNPLTTNCINGSVIVGVQPTATSTETPTATPTDTPPPPTATSTPATASPTITRTTPASTATATATATTVSTTPTPQTPTVAPTSTNTPPRRSPTRSPHPADSDSCQIVSGATSAPAWILLAPVVALLRLRRRRR